MEMTLQNVSFSRVITELPDSDWGVSMYTSRSFQEFPRSVVEQNRKGKICYFMASGTCLPAEKNMKVDLTGNWKQTKYGEQFAVRSFAVRMPDTMDEIVAFLKSGAIKGIGKKTAERIVDTFGEETLNVMAENPEKLLTVKGIKASGLEKIKQSIGVRIGYQKLQALLSPAGFSTERITEAYKALGERSAEEVKQNPYCLMKVRGIGFAGADRVARMLDAKLDSKERMVAALQAAALALSNRDGHVYLKKDVLITEALKLLNEGNPKVLLERENVSHALETTRKDELIIRFPGELDAVYLPEFDQAEFAIADEVSKLIKKAHPDRKWLEALETWQKNHPEICLTKGQEEAAYAACENSILVITGGAGTGKTTVAKALIESYRKAHKGMSVTLLAPTGKAARRLSEATGEYASTIHSALKMQTGNGFLYYQERLNEGLVVVDEASMVDLFVMQALLSAMTGDSVLVLLGDVNQLPSVGAGAVLDELIRSEKVKTVRLTEIMRQNEDSLIIGNAIRINQGNCRLKSGDDFQFIPAWKGNVQETVLSVFFQEVKETGLDQTIVLTPLRRWGDVSASELNRKIQQQVTGSSPSGQMCHGTRFCIGDKVIQTRNTDQVSNGDVGYLTSITSEPDEDGKHEIVFRIAFESGITVDYKRKDMEDIDLAYALTIHKSQGSEYQTVIIPLLTDYQCPLYKRNLLYTAVTRARKKVILIGHQEAIEICTRTKDTGIRNTLLANRIYLMCR